jgi:hypothetical protein
MLDEPKAIVNELDQLFLFTKTEPKLYYLPLTEAQAEERLERLKHRENSQAVINDNNKNIK